MLDESLDDGSWEDTKTVAVDVVGDETDGSVKGFPIKKLSYFFTKETSNLDYNQGVLPPLSTGDLAILEPFMGRCQHKL